MIPLRLIVVLLRVQRIRAIGVVFVSVLLLSLSVSNIAMIINGVYDVLNNIIAPNKSNMISIYSGSALTPFTGLISREYEQKLSEINGVKEVWAELVVPCIAKGRAIVVRGIEDSFLRELLGLHNNNTIIYSYAWIGEGAAKYLGVKVGDEIVVYSLFNNMPLMLKIVRIVRLPEPYNDEILVSLETAQLLRGVHGGLVGLIKAVFNPTKTTYKEILMKCNITALKKTSIQLYILEKALLIISLSPSSTVTMGSANILERLGFSRDLLIIVSIVITLLLSYIVFLSGKHVVLANYFVFNVFRVLGVASYSIKMIMIFFYIPIILLATLLGAILSYYLITHMDYYIFSYKILPRLDCIQLILMSVIYVCLFISGISLERGYSSDE